ncbi:hypothetical protein TNIN_364141 [Trichonephila inaurata madagascariensis]|uniref:Uncharacterized protein n=1 Tax=Trichonephila inaurata madagascariensis TaxID=2747483 RepID=A0A8X6XEV7_9ARAC|nr:hypothetical protein TNIN_364141 [Trichonephila inaurata madagascariensis]
MPEAENVMKKIRTVDMNIKKFENLILKHKTGAHTEGYKLSLKRSRRTRETLVRELQLLAPCTVPDCPDHFSAQAGSNAKKNPHSEEIKSKPQKRKDSQDDFVFPKKTVRPNSPIKTPEPVLTQNNFDSLQQDVEQAVNDDNEKDNENNIPKPTPPYHAQNY